MQTQMQIPKDSITDKFLSIESTSLDQEACKAIASLFEIDCDRYTLVLANNAQIFDTCHVGWAPTCIILQP